MRAGSRANPASPIRCRDSAQSMTSSQRASPVWGQGSAAATVQSEVPNARTRLATSAILAGAIRRNVAFRMVIVRAVMSAALTAFRSAGLRCVHESSTQIGRPERITPMMRQLRM